MKHTVNSARSMLLTAIGFFLAATSLFVFQAYADDMFDYMTFADELDRIGPDFARTHGKKELIGEYRRLIDSHPGFANNMQMEVQIAYIHEWDLADSGQPPDPKAAFETLSNAIKTYDPNHPYMKTVRRLAADRAANVDQAVAKEMYTSLMEDYPDDNALAAECLFSMGQLAEKQGNLAGATELYEKAINCAPDENASSDTNPQSVQVYRSNAAAALLGLLVRRYDDPKERLHALDAYLLEHSDLLQSFGDLVQRIRETVASQTQQQPGIPEATAAAQTTSASNPIASQDPGSRTRQGVANSGEQNASVPGSEMPSHATRKAGDSQSQTALPGEGSARRSGLAETAGAIVASPAGRILLPVLVAAAALAAVVLIRRRLS